MVWKNDVPCCRLGARSRLRQLPSHILQDIVRHAVPQQPCIVHFHWSCWATIHIVEQWSQATTQCTSMATPYKTMYIHGHTLQHIVPYESQHSSWPSRWRHLGVKWSPELPLMLITTGFCLSSDVDWLSKVQFNNGVLAVCCVHDIAVISGLARVWLGIMTRFWILLLVNLRHSWLTLWLGPLFKA